MYIKSETSRMLNKKTQLSLRKTRYNLYSSYCSTDFQGH